MAVSMAAPKALVRSTDHPETGPRPSDEELLLATGAAKMSYAASFWNHLRLRGVGKPLIRDF